MLRFNSLTHTPNDKFDKILEKINSRVKYLIEIYEFQQSWEEFCIFLLKLVSEN